MDNSWVKLYRKIGENPIMLDDKACRVFLWLLIHVDKRTGTLTAGRFMISQDLEINPSTVYKVLKRLEEKYKIVTLNSNNKFTTISLSNWAKYNPYTEKVTQEGNNKVTTKEQQSNNKVTHIQDIKTLRHSITNVILPDESGTDKKERKKTSYQEIITYCRESQGITQEYVNYVKQTTAVKKILTSKYTLEDIKFVIDEMTQDPYWSQNPFDMMSVANNMHKYMNRTVLFDKKKGGNNGHAKKNPYLTIN